LRSNAFKQPNQTDIQQYFSCFKWTIFDQVIMTRLTVT
jgi:hypothetical protein